MGDRELRRNIQRLRALARQRLFQSGYVVGKSVASRDHADERIINSVICDALKST